MKPMFTVVILSKCVNSNITLGLFLWLHPARLASGSIMFLGRAFVHSSVTKPQTQYSENEWTDFIVPTGTSDLRGKGMKWSSLKVWKSQDQGTWGRSRSEKLLSARFSRAMRRILTKPGRHILQKCLFCHNGLNTKGQRSRSHEAKGRFRGLAVPSFLIRLGQAAFLVCITFLILYCHM